MATPIIKWLSDDGEVDKVVITCATSGTEIYYTTDGGKLTSSTKYDANDKITVTAGILLTLKVTAMKAKCLNFGK